MPATSARARPPPARSRGRATRAERTAPALENVRHVLVRHGQLHGAPPADVSRTSARPCRRQRHAVFSSDPTYTACGRQGPSGPRLVGRCRTRERPFRRRCDPTRASGARLVGRCGTGEPVPTSVRPDKVVRPPPCRPLPHPGPRSDVVRPDKGVRRPPCRPLPHRRACSDVGATRQGRTAPARSRPCRAPQRRSA